MLRLTHLLRLLEPPSAATVPHRASAPIPSPSSAPVVIWNLTRRCNLTCRHCYAFAADHPFPNELTPDEALTVVADLDAAGVRVLVLSGGEPVLRPDLFAIAAAAQARGMYVALSSNGTLIDAPLADRIAAQGFDYVGISIDGLEATHDRFRRQEGAFRASLAAIDRLVGLGVKVGLRLTLTRDNAAELPEVLDLMAERGVAKFYLSHLNYAGRGGANRGDSAHHAMTRAALDLLIARAHADLRRGVECDYVTGNNDADALYLLLMAMKRYPSGAVARLRRALVRWGGNAAGVGIANIDAQGEVHPDTMWGHYRLGNIRQRSFAEIWADCSDPVMAGLKLRPRRVTGRCGTCPALAICNGNTRVRAYKQSGDPWGADPGCYLTDAECAAAMGLVSGTDGCTGQPVLEEA